MQHHYSMVKPFKSRCQMPMRYTSRPRRRACTSWFPGSFCIPRAFCSGYSYHLLSASSTAWSSSLGSVFSAYCNHGKCCPAARAPCRPQTCPSFARAFPTTPAASRHSPPTDPLFTVSGVPPSTSWATSSSSACPSPQSACPAHRWPSRDWTTWDAFPIRCRQSNSWCDITNSCQFCFWHPWYSTS